jgi:hypothetical protein
MFPVRRPKVTHDYPCHDATGSGARRKHSFAIAAAQRREALPPAAAADSQATKARTCLFRRPFDWAEIQWQRFAYERADRCVIVHVLRDENLRNEKEQPVEGTDGLRYYVQLADGDVHRVTLDQLDEGFQKGHIDANTRVLADGATGWTTLGKLAGIDDPAPLATAPPPFVIPPYTLPPAPATRAPMNALPSPNAPVFHSHRPVSIDLSDLELTPAPRPASGKRWFAALIGVAMVGSLGAVALKRPSWAQPYLSRLGVHTVGATGVAAPTPPIAAPPPPPSEPPPSPIAAVTSQPAVPAAGPASEAASTPMDSTHWAGALHAKKAKGRKPLAPTGGAHASAPAKGRPTMPTTVGSKYDPLSSSI